ncbi:MAG: zinc-binding alcohol dehydrogenase [Pseudomonadota bacterium]
MACPHQLGQFPFPVMYGYGFVGEIVDGARERRGRAAFCLHPHATYAVVPETDVHLVPYGLPARRAILTANMETALNVVWDARISGGDRVVVMGAGVVGLLVGYLAAQFPGATVLVCDPDPSRRALAETLGCEVVAPDAAAEWVDANDGLPFDVAINASASGEALTAAIDLLGVEGRVVEASWFGARSVDLRLGGAFHSQRLQIVSSQVGRIPADRQARWTYARRIAVALRLLDDDRLDTLITHEVAFDEAPDVLPPLFDDPEALGIALKYPTAERRAPSAR